MNLLDIFFPRRCVGCHKVGSYFCPHCLEQVKLIENPICPLCGKLSIGGYTHAKCKTPLSLDGLIAFAHYQGPVKKAIHLLKYSYVSDLTKQLVDSLVDNNLYIFPKFDNFIPVPLHGKREKFRGFNQSFLIAKELSKKLNISVLENILIRQEETIPQYQLDKEKRTKNMKGVFFCLDKKFIMGKSIAVIDDVATTISTLSECTKVLKRNGAKKVWGIVLAHG